MVINLNTAKVRAGFDRAMVAEASARPMIEGGQVTALSPAQFLLAFGDSSARALSIVG